MIELAVDVHAAGAEAGDAVESVREVAAAPRGAAARRPSA